MTVDSELSLEGV